MTKVALPLTAPLDNSRQQRVGNGKLDSMHMHEQPAHCAALLDMYPRHWGARRLIRTG